jgi:uncharacterized protein YoxC
MTLPEAAIIMAFVVQFAGLVWGSAQISNSVTHLDKTIENLRKMVEQLEERTNNHEVRVSVLERVTTGRRFDDA